MTPHLKARMAAGEALVGTFVKTPSHTAVEMMAHAGMDFLCLDAEHGPFGRAELDSCLAMGRALGVPMLVRVMAGRPELILAALDSGATGLVIPHVDSAAKAADVARSAHFGLGGRGFAGATRWAGVAGAPMPEVLRRSSEETVVLAQIEEPAGVDAAHEIAATDGIDGLFIGPSDLSVSYGHQSADNSDLDAAFKTVGAACTAARATFVTWAPTAAAAKARAEAYGVSMSFIGSDQSLMLQAARAAAAEMRDT